MFQRVSSLFIVIFWIQSNASCFGLVLQLADKTRRLLLHQRRSHHDSVSLTTRLLQKAAHDAHRTAAAAQTNTVEDNCNDDDESSSNIHLLSLQWTEPTMTTSDDGSVRKFSQSVANVWRWKDAVLGDGRDFFVPKPKTLRALQSYLLKASSSPHLRDCVVLSNCARLEVLVVVKSQDDDESDATTDPTRDISSLLVRQVQAHNSRRRLSFKAVLQLPLDWPGNIVPHVATGDDFDDSTTLHSNKELVNDLSQHWTHYIGPRAIAQHLSLVAAGMAPHPRRPPRPKRDEVVFRPFSSRDAHILLQLKRTLDVASDSFEISELLKCAIRAGKAARNPKHVPELLELKQYGSGNSKFDTAPPANATRCVMQAAKSQAIDPCVEQCLESFKAVKHAKAIVRLRSQALTYAENAQERQYVQRELHEPTLALRRGESVDEAALLAHVRNQLLIRRRHAACSNVVT